MAGIHVISYIQNQMRWDDKSRNAIIIKAAMYFKNNRT